MINYICESDRSFIENKYHLISQPFDPFNRFPYHGFKCDAETGLNDEQMETELNRLFDEKKGMSHALAKAEAFAFVLDNMTIGLSKHDYFPAFYNWGRPLQKTFVGKWWEESFSGIQPVRDKMWDFMVSGTADLWLDTEHVVPNWIDIFKLGFSGILERVRKYKILHKNNSDFTQEQFDFLKAIETEYSAILRLIKRFHDYAIAHPNEKSKEIAESLDRLYNGVPQNTFDALQLMYFYFMCSESIDQYQVRSLGNGLDRTLYKYYKKDVETGTFTKERIGEFLAYFMLQFSAIGNYWGQPFYLVGKDFDNKTDISVFTHLILDVYESLNIYNPKIQIKIDFDTPSELIYHVLKLIRNGHTSFVLCCIPGMIKSLMSCYGVTEEEARNCDISGCNEMHIRANESCMISALPNAAKAINYVFSNGYDFITCKQLGLKTGNIEDFATFEDFYSAFLKQFKNIIDSVITMARQYEPFAAVINPSVMLSGAIENSLKTGLDGYTYALKYTTSSLLLCSFATTVDSILAVKELVYDKKETTLTELKKALDNNWEGYEVLRQKAKNAPKYGNGDSRADTYATALFRWFATYVTGKHNSRGGVYKVGVPSTLHFISQGKLTAATPDGRKFGEECSKNVAPVIGTEKKGTTGIVHSILSLSPFLFSEAFVLDLMLHPSAVSGEEGLKALYSIVMNYMKQDGISIQFNIFSPELLRDAQAHPEKYENLEVRVSGWNVLWNNLSKEEQDAYIIRAESLQ